MSSGYTIDQDLIDEIGLKQPRSDRVSLCFGVTEIDKVKNGENIHMQKKAYFSQFFMFSLSIISILFAYMSELVYCCTRHF